MKKTLRQIFDGVTPEELELFGSVQPLTVVSDDMRQRIMKKTYEKIEKTQPVIKTKRKKSGRAFYLRRITAAAVCLCLTVAILFGAGVFEWNSIKPEWVPDPDVNENLNGVGDLLAWESYENIIWNDRKNEQDAVVDPDSSEEEKETSEVDIVEVIVEWNGLKISDYLFQKFTVAESNAVFAIGVKSISKPEVTPADFVYNGKTYAQIMEAYNKLSSLQTDYLMLKEFSCLYDRISKEDEWDFWEKVYGNLDEGFIKQYFDGTEFDCNAISNDQAECANLYAQTESEKDDCERAYKAKYMPTPDLGELAKQGYFVVERYGVYVVFVSAEKMEKFAADAVALYDPVLLENTLFDVAGREDLALNDSSDDVIENELTSEGGGEMLPSVDDVIEEDTTWAESITCESVIEEPQKVGVGYDFEEETKMTDAEYDVKEQENCP